MRIERDWLFATMAELHEAVRGAVNRRNAVSKPVAVNRKGDVPDASDLTADETVRRFLRERFRVGAILSEEGEDEVGGGTGTLQFVIDPVDGTDNFRRGLPGSTVCVAAFPSHAPISVGTVQWAMVGDYRSPHPAIAIRGEGAWCDGKRLTTSQVTNVSAACLHFELNQHAASRPLALLLERAGAIRGYCSTAYAICLVAQGALDAHIDARSRVTPESYLAASLVLTEAGGVILDANGRMLEPFRDLTDRRSILAAATPQLAQELSFVLRG